MKIKIFLNLINNIIVREFAVNFELFLQVKIGIVYYLLKYELQCRGPQLIIFDNANEEIRSLRN